MLVYQRVYIYIVEISTDYVCVYMYIIYNEYLSINSHIHISLNADMLNNVAAGMSAYIF